jgi:hypothetical protein
VVVRNLEAAPRNWPAALSGLRIAHASDFHFTRWNAVYRHAQQLLESLDYDLLLLTGDFGNFRRHWRHAVEMTRRFFDPLAGRRPAYAVLGNHDHPLFATAADLPFVLLRDESIKVPLRGTHLSLAGVEQTAPRGGELLRALSQIEDKTPTVLLAHYPSTAFRLKGRDVQLVLSGHTHGGQIRLPWLGCLWPNDHVPRAMARGLHRVHDALVHVSAGIGASLPIRVRIHCPPEISILTLR